ncbi:serine protease snake-like [Apis dorsata]|uniref:serine protease snake-like n=1 Tax=Apis dorsata TaxID=7462 RepID=UPI0003DF712B|nr:serine protease snake-like [Apis dorsata]
MLIIMFLYFLCNPIFCNTQDEDEPCITNNNLPGICKLLQQCPSVYENLLKGLSSHKICGYLNFDPVVCCPDIKKISTTTIRTTTTKKTTAITTFLPFTAKMKTKAKCEEYSRYVYTTEYPPTLINNKKPVNKSLCYIKDRTLIVGGTKAEAKEFPHMAAIGFDTLDGIVWACGGTLISERFVLTAAHCTFNRNLNSTANWVRLGDLNLERSDDYAKPENFRVIERIRNPHYKPPSQYHDIALLKLESDVQFNAWIRPSCLPYSLPDSGLDGKATATGWGDVEWHESGSNDLLKVTISLVSQPKCNKLFIGNEKNNKLKFGITEDSQICAGELGKDTCQGDSGGPLVILNRDYDCMYTLIGVTSLGKLCGTIIPGIYTRVYNYISWIENIVWPDL